MRFASEILLCLIGAWATIGGAASDRDWPVYGGSAAGDRYSELTQINRSNVHQLQILWRYDTGNGGLQTSPIEINGILYAYTPQQSIIALDAVTGALKWKFDPPEPSGQPARGVAYWRRGGEQRLLASCGHDLYALDPLTGRAIPTFGESGRVDLRKGLDRPYTELETPMTAPGIVYRDLIVVGFRAAETAPAAPGAVRAYDVRSGKLRWIFHLIPRPHEPGYDTWPTGAWTTAGAANSWAGFALDEKRGIVYVPTGSVAPDFYGDRRLGDDLFANTLLALDAATGKRLWHFQAVHHDLWDKDFASPPSLLTVIRDDKHVDAVAQVTKQGFVFLFDRVTGRPLFPIEEHPVPGSAVPGEQASPTQPWPTAPAPFARQRLTADLLTQRTPAAHAWALEQYRTFVSGELFTPLSVDKPTIVFPGFDGGAEWGGAAIDRRTGVLYVNSNDIAWTGSLTAAKPLQGLAASLYQAQCASCHGPDRRGSPPAFPSLIDVAQRLDAGQMLKLLREGRGRMPAFSGLPQPSIEALIEYLRTGADDSARSRINAPGRDAKSELSSPIPQGATERYLFTGYNRFYDPDGYPAVAPPWGTLNAIDLNTGQYLWKIPLGEYPELLAQGLKNTGTENYGGPLATASGLVIIGATIFDRKLRAFDSRTGELLWQGELPFAGVATPITYRLQGRQYVLIACSGNRDGKGPQGSAYVAFALPRSVVAGSTP